MVMVITIKVKIKMCNDPTAGSPTVALLRLLFPLNHIVRISFHRYIPNRIRD